MSKNGNTSDFVREAIREKALRELSALNQRAEAFTSVERARDALFTVTNELSSSASAVAAVSSEKDVAAKLKKLRKLVEDGHVLATELADVLGVDAQREAVTTARQAILDALKSAGLDPASVLPAEGGDAQ